MNNQERNGGERIRMIIIIIIWLVLASCLILRRFSHRHYPREPNKTNGCSFLHERGGNVSAFACRIMNYRFSKTIRKRILYTQFA